MRYPIPPRKPALFISYDGLLDPLGSSQILPYVRGLSVDRRMHILSFEKPDRFAADDNRLARELVREGISWTPLRFTRAFGKAGKIWDLFRMYAVACRLQWVMRFGIIHCRSYLSAQVGCLLKRIFGPKVIFDMRGLWVDERVDGNLWNLRKFLDRLAYHYYKGIERRLLGCANHIVTLTHRSVPVIRQLAPGLSAPISVIPCCADYDALWPLSATERERARDALQIPRDALVISYLGSLGTWYQFDEMLDFFRKTLREYSNAHFLIITKDWSPTNQDKVVSIGGQELLVRITVRQAARSEVRPLLGCSDVMLNFIRPAFSKLASSPIKFGEAMAMGIPTISSRGIGDVDELTESLEAGVCLDPKNPREMDSAIKQLPTLLSKGGARLVKASRPWLGLEVALSQYSALYEEVSK